MRRAVKQLCEIVLGNHSVTSTLCRISKRDVVLAYHNVVPDDHPEEGDQSLHLPLAQFIEQINWLDSIFQIVPVTAILSEPIDQAVPRAAITFDDAYEGAVRYGMPFLARKKLPATIFQCLAWKGGETMWWDALSDPRIGAVRPAERNRALRISLGRRVQVLESAEVRRMQIRIMRAPLRIALIAELESAVDSGLFTVGSHTCTHPNLLLLDDQDLQNELSVSRAELEARWGNRAIPWLAYPFGLADTRVADAARTAGYEGAFLASGGVLRRPIRSVHELTRINVPASMTLAGLRLRVAGLIRG